jgi:hypothetical protein
MYEVHIDMRFRTKTRERAKFIIKQVYRARKVISKLDITEKSVINSNITPIQKD